jgi:hypothetical protein
LNFKCILNGCASNVKAQAEELNGFIDGFLGGGTNPGSTILFYAHKEDRQALLGLVPTDRAELVFVDRFSLKPYWMRCSASRVVRIQPFTFSRPGLRALSWLCAGRFASEGLPWFRWNRWTVVRID